MVMGSWGHHAAHPWTAPLYNVKLLDQKDWTKLYVGLVLVYYESVPVNFQHVTITGRAANVAKGDGIC